MSVRFLADENFNNRIVLGCVGTTRPSTSHLCRGSVSAPQTTPLFWHGPLTLIGCWLTHDIATIPGYAHERVSAGLPMPGVLVVGSAMPIASVIEEVLLIAGASEPDEWKDSVRTYRCAS